MGTPFIGEIRMFTMDWAPRGWARCDGQLLPINQNQALFSLLGTTYGGNGQTNFALPDLRARVPMHRGQNTRGARLGEAAHTLTWNELPQHLHFPMGSSGAAQSIPLSNGLVPAASNKDLYVPTAFGAVSTGTLSSTGGNQPHENRMPSLVLCFCISLIGAFPTST